MKRNVLALALSLAMVLSVGGVALAQEGGSGLLIAPNPTAQQTPATDVPKAEAAPEQEGDALSFYGLDDKLRDGGYAMQAMKEGMAQLQEIDYDELTKQLQQTLSDTVQLHWETITMTDTVLKGLEQVPFLNLTMEDQVVLQTALSVSTKSAAASLEDACQSLRESIEDVQEGRTQRDNEDLLWQLRTTRDQTVILGENSFIMLVGLQRSQQTLVRSMAALDRAIQEMEMRYDMGQVSALTLQEVRANRAALESTARTLEMNITNLRLNLEMMLGMELTGTLQAAALPEVTQQQLSEMDLAADLEKAKRNSYSLRAAQVKLEEAEEAWEQAQEDYDEDDYARTVAQHSWKSAQYTYQAAVQQFEVNFHALYAKVKDQAQIMGAKQTLLAVEQDACAAARLKFTQGSISQNALLTAQDELAAAQEAVDTARDDLFSGYRSYCWAVEQGILN